MNDVLESVGVKGDKAIISKIVNACKGKKVDDV
jgi:ribosomal protein L12E/L44/L45/RPP1/RPP2